ncbi:tenascin [Apostichopus japonicus]|uniref:Tenascin n=1 Tax=Stichopus japonicus TaxID=307972 RepID=A0A2G8LAH5_STIJA|nr:tenascin [Apostichopus japonicus]
MHMGNIVNDDCTQMFLYNNQLICEDYRCSTNAVCDVRNEYDSVIVMRDMKVFQRRTDGSTSLIKTGMRTKTGLVTRNLWLGNEKLHYLTNQRNYKLRFDITTSSGSAKYAEYTEFQVESESSKYRMNKLGLTGGNTGDYFYRNKGKQFDTPDRDNDACDIFNCAEKHRSGWWHSDNWRSDCYGKIVFVSNTAAVAILFVLMTTSTVSTMEATEK